MGLLLMQMPEEESFAVLVKIMQDYRMREMFKPSMAELGLCMYQAGGQAFKLKGLFRENSIEKTCDMLGLVLFVRVRATSYFNTEVQLKTNSIFLANNMAKLLVFKKVCISIYS